MAFSTCSSHLVVGILFFGSASITYWRLKSNHSARTDGLLLSSTPSWLPCSIQWYIALGTRGWLQHWENYYLKHSKMDLHVVFWETCWLSTFSPWKAIHYQLMMYFVTLKFQPEI
jgi:hypothetical protein